MLSAFIPTELRYPAMPLAGQLVHRRFVQPGPLVLWPTPLKFPTRMVDRDRHSVTSPLGHQESTNPFGRPGRFRRALHVTMQFGLYLHLYGGDWALALSLSLLMPGV
jgi:hypothetical protein